MIVDDHPIVCLGMAQLINSQDDLELCCESDDAAGALVAARACCHDLVIVDISLPGVSGFDLIKNLKCHDPTLAVLVMSMYEDSDDARRALRAGANGYIVKREAAQAILAAIRELLRGGAYLSPEIQLALWKRVIAPSGDQCSAPASVLSEREHEVLRLIGLGFGTSQIADQLHRSVKTIEAHRSNIKAKLKLTSSGQLVRFAVRLTSRGV